MQSDQTATTQIPRHCFYGWYLNITEMGGVSMPVMHAPVFCASVDVPGVYPSGIWVTSNSADAHTMAERINSGNLPNMQGIKVNVCCATGKMIEEYGMAVDWEHSEVLALRLTFEAAGQAIENAQPADMPVDARRTAHLKDDACMALYEVFDQELSKYTDWQKEGFGWFLYYRDKMNSPLD